MTAALFGQRLRESAIVRNGALVFAAQMTVNVCNFAFHAIVSRRIGVTAYGTLNALVSGFQVLQVPALIMLTVLVKYASTFAAQGAQSRLRALLSRSMTVLSVTAAIVFLTGAAASGAISGFLHGADRSAVLLMLGILCLNLVLPIRGILQGLERFKPYSISLSVEAIVKVLCAAVFTWIGWGLGGALGGWLAGCTVALVYTWVVQWIPYRKLPEAKLQIDLREAVVTTGGIALATLFVASLGFSDVVLVKHYFDPVAAGLYGAAALAGKMLYFLVYFVPAVVLPRVAIRAAEGKPTRSILMGALGVVLLLGGTGTAVYYFYGSAVVQILAGHAFAQAAPLVFPYGVAATLLAGLNTAVIYRIGLGRYDFILPLGALAIAQIVAIAFFHATAIQVIEVVIACNIAALVLTMLPPVRPAGRPQPRGANA